MPVNQLIQVRRDTAANWTSVHPTLAAGEIGYETDTKKFKVGDGTTSWTSLAYAPAGIGYGTGAAITTITGSGGAITLPASGVVATTSVTDNFLQVDGTIKNGSSLTGNLNLGTQGIQTSHGTYTFPTTGDSSSGGAVIVASDVSTNYLSKTGTTTQTVASSITIASGKTISTPTISVTGSNGATFSNSGGASTGVAKINASGVLTGGNVISLTGSDISGALGTANGGLATNVGTTPVPTGGSGLAYARSVLRQFVQANPPSSVSTDPGYIVGYTPANGDLWFY